MEHRSTSKFFGTLALAAVLAAPSFAQNAKISDAQVEASVLKAFAGDNRLANQPINTSTVFGTVTLSGSVTNEAARDAAEQLASRTEGVKKVVDQLTVGEPPAGADPATANSMPEGASMPAYRGQAQAAQQQQAPPPPPPGGYNTPGQPGDPNGQYQQQPQQGQYPPPQGQYPQQGQYPPQGQYGPPQQGYPQGAPQGQYPAYGQAQPPQDGNYPPPPPRRLYRRDFERGGQGGQPGGIPVVVPPDTVLAVSINHWLSSDNADVGSAFTAIVANDVVAGGQIAIPRGATVDGQVIAVKGAGALKGRGSLTLQLNTLEMGGQRYPLQVDPFTVTGHDKTARSVGSTIVGAGIGALFGGAIGGGAGAAIGAGVGGAAGLGTAAASRGGNANLPPEALLRFRVTAPVPVRTVSEAEMQRLGGYAGPGPGRGAYPPPPPPPPGYYGRPYPY